MALYSNNVLLGALGGPQYTQDQQDPTRQQIDNIRDYAKTALGATLPTTMYNPLQGVGYLLDKFQGRNEADRANELQKSALAQALAGTAGGQQAPTDPSASMTTGSIDQSQGQVQPQAQPTAQVAPQPAAQPQAIAPQLKPSIAPSGGVPAKLVIASPQGQESEVTPDQIAGGLPDGYKVVKAVDAQGNDIPVPAAQAPVQMPQAAAAQQPPVAAPNQVAQAAPQASPITTGSNPQAAGQGSGGITIGPPPVRPNLPPSVLKHILALDPEDQKVVMSQYEAANTPQLSDTGFGTIWQLPDGRKGFMPKTQISSMKAEGADIPIAISGGPNGITSKSLVPGGAPGSGASGAGGGIDDIINHFAGLKANNDAHAAALSETAKDSAKNYGTMYTSLQDAGTHAQDENKNLAAQRSIIDNPNFKSGAYSGAINDAGKVANQLGLDTNVGKTAQLQSAYQKLRASQNLTSLQSLKGLGQIRVAEINLINQANGDLSNDVPVNRAINEINQRTTQRAQDIAQQARDYKSQHGQLDAGFEQQLSEYKTNHPLFSDQEIADYSKLFNKDGSSSGSSGADPLEGKTATGPNNQQIVRKNGKWVPVEK